MSIWIVLRIRCWRVPIPRPAGKGKGGGAIQRDRISLCADVRARFFLLLQGLWWDAGQVLADPLHLAAARDKIEASMPDVVAEEAAICLGFGAYFSVLMGDFDAATTWLARAASVQAAAPGDLAGSYIEALRHCIASGDSGSPLCAPCIAE